MMALEMERVNWIVGVRKCNPMYLCKRKAGEVDHTPRRESGGMMEQRDI